LIWHAVLSGGSMTGRADGSLMQQLLDPGDPRGIMDYGKAGYLQALPDDAIDEMVRRAGQAGSPVSAVILCPLGGQMSQVDREGMALQHPRHPLDVLLRGQLVGRRRAGPPDRLGP
jgi:hypothetical protein